MVFCLLVWGVGAWGRERGGGGWVDEGGADGAVHGGILGGGLASCFVSRGGGRLDFCRGCLRCIGRFGVYAVGVCVILG